MLGNFLDQADNYRKVIGDIHSRLGMDNPVPLTPTTVMRTSLSQLTPGAKLADMLVKDAIPSAAGHGAASVAEYGSRASPQASLVLKWPPHTPLIRCSAVH